MIGLLHDQEARERVAEVEDEQLVQRGKLRMHGELHERIVENLVFLNELVPTLLQEIRDLRIAAGTTNIVNQQPTPPEVGDGANSTEVQRIAKIAVAIEAERAVDFDYVKEGGDASSRTVSPYTIEYQRDGSALLTGFDHRQQGMRRFRIDRTSNVIYSDATFVAPEEQD